MRSMLALRRKKGVGAVLREIAARPVNALRSIVKQSGCRGGWTSDNHTERRFVAKFVATGGASMPGARQRCRVANTHKLKSNAPSSKSRVATSSRERLLPDRVTISASSPCTVTSVSKRLRLVCFADAFFPARCGGTTNSVKLQSGNARPTGSSDAAPSKPSFAS